MRLLLGNDADERAVDARLSTLQPYAVGVQAGRRAAMDVVAMATTAAPDDLRAAGARAVVADVTELHHVLLPAAADRGTQRAPTSGGAP